MYRTGSCLSFGDHSHIVHRTDRYVLVHQGMHVRVGFRFLIVLAVHDHTDSPVLQWLHHSVTVPVEHAAGDGAVPEDTLTFRERTPGEIHVVDHAIAQGCCRQFPEQFRKVPVRHLMAVHGRLRKGDGMTALKCGLEGSARTQSAGVPLQA